MLKPLLFDAHKISFVNKLAIQKLFEISMAAATATTAASAADSLYGTTVSAESIKVIAESMGVGVLSDDAAKELAEDISNKLKRIAQDAVKFRDHAKRDKLLMSDIDAALRLRKVEPQYGFVVHDCIPFRFASGGGRELHFIEERETDLQEIVQAVSQRKLPFDISIRSHWLVVDGIQPTIPENPPPLSKDAQALEAVNPVMKLEQGLSKDSAGKPTTGKLHKLRNMETVHIKQLATHELSVEQQLYYKEITEACVGSDEPRRGEALQSLASDPGLHEMLPRMCTFIAEGVKVNVVQNNLALLIYLMRMVKALLDNPALYLEKYLHELVPSVTTCIVSRQLCMRPELDNHWALRDFASRLMAQICRNFNTSTNNLQTRVTRIFSKALQNDKTHLSSLYGSIAGLAELGAEVIKVFIVPRLKFISDRIEGHLLGTAQSNTEKTAAGHIRAMLQKCCPPILKQLRNAPDYSDEYKQDYGFLGPALCQAVIKARSAPTQIATSNATSAPVTINITSTPFTATSQATSPSARIIAASSGATQSRLGLSLSMSSSSSKIVSRTQQTVQLRQTSPQPIVVSSAQMTPVAHTIVLSPQMNGSNSSSGMGCINLANSSIVDSTSIIEIDPDEEAPPEMEDLSHLE